MFSLQYDIGNFIFTFSFRIQKFHIYAKIRIWGKMLFSYIFVWRKTQKKMVSPWNKSLQKLTKILSFLPLSQIFVKRTFFFSCSASLRCWPNVPMGCRSYALFLCYENLSLQCCGGVLLRHLGSISPKLSWMLYVKRICDIFGT